MTPRRLRELGAAAAVVAVVSGILVAAVQADGRTSVRTDTNDGGAWLVRRSDGLTGHLNRAVGEVSGVVHIAGPGAEFDVEQADGIVLGHDRSLSTLTVVDPRTFQIVNDVAVPVDARVAAVTGGAIVWQPSPLRVWSLDVAALTSTTSIDEVAPIVSTEGSGSALVTFDEDLVVLDVERQQLLRYPVRQGLASGGEGSSITPLGGLAERITSMTTVGDTVVAMTDDGVVVFEVGDADAAATAAASPVEVGEPGLAVLAQPAPEGSPIVGVRPDGSVVRIDPEAGAEPAQRPARWSISRRSVPARRWRRSSTRAACSRWAPNRRRSRASVTASPTRRRRSPAPIRRRCGCGSSTDGCGSTT